MPIDIDITHAIEHVPGGARALSTDKDPDVAKENGQAPIVARAASVSRPYEEFLGCRHEGIHIDATQRTVTCKACGKFLDPVWCLQQLV